MISSVKDKCFEQTFGFCSGDRDVQRCKQHLQTGWKVSFPLDNVHSHEKFYKAMDTFHTPLRDGWPHQNGWIFGKFPNGLWSGPPPLSWITKVFYQGFHQVVWPTPTQAAAHNQEREPDRSRVKTDDCLNVAADQNSWQLKVTAHSKFTVAQEKTVSFKSENGAP